MKSNGKPLKSRQRGLIFTAEALALVNGALEKRWDHSDRRTDGQPRKLTVPQKHELLGKLSLNTFAKILRREEVDESTLRTVWESLEIEPAFSRERHCVATNPRSADIPLPTTGNLPRMATRCIGREDETREILRLLDTGALVTLTGLGGIGKTRLAKHVGAALKGQFAAGVWLVELAGLDAKATESDILRKIAAALGIREEMYRTLSETLKDSLRDKAILLILDNCEHLRDACARVLFDLLSACHDMKAIATSRERMNISFEQPFPLSGLATPDPKRFSDAHEDTVSRLMAWNSVQLFVERARRQKPQFAVTPENAPHVAAICSQLAGVPLMLELAAGRMRSLSVKALDERLSDCLNTLVGGSPIPLSQHETFRATLDWSYKPLPPEEKALLQRLSVFAGGCSGEAVKKVCSPTSAGGDAVREEAAVFHRLESLIHKSLVVEQDDGEESRYSLLEPVRQYAAEQWKARRDYDTIKRLYRDYFLELAERAEPELMGAKQAEWSRRLEAEHENFRAALEWSFTQEESEETLRLCGALSAFWRMRGYFSEGREWCEKALKMPNGQNRTRGRAKALNGAGTLAYFQSDYAIARCRQEEARIIWEELGDKRGIAITLNRLGYAVAAQGDLDYAKSCFETGVAYWSEIGDSSHLSRALNSLGDVALNQGDWRTAQSNHEKSLALCEAVGDKSGIAYSLACLARVARHQGDFAAAQSIYEKCLLLAQETGDQYSIGNTLSDMGFMALHRREHAAAMTCFEQSITILRQIGERRGMAQSLRGMGLAAGYQEKYTDSLSCFQQSLLITRDIGDQERIPITLDELGDMLANAQEMEQAAVLWGVTATLREEMDIPFAPSMRPGRERNVAAARQVLGEEEFVAAWARGKQMTLGEAVGYAMCCRVVGVESRWRR